MQTTGTIEDISIDYKTRKAKISIVLDSKELDSIEHLKNDGKLKIEMKKYREPRSLNANNYFWKLLQELCEKQDIDTIEEYRRRVKQLGIFKRWRVEEKDLDTFVKSWENWGIAWFCEVADTEYLDTIEFKIVNAYYGSSSFNSKQMSRLIDSLVQDCKAIGIETKTQEEIESLIKSWH